MPEKNFKLAYLEALQYRMPNLNLVTFGVIPYVI